MTCKQLGGSCDLMFNAKTFEDISDLSKNHAKEMFAKGDQEHITAMNAMMEMMKKGEVDAWMTARRAEFESQQKKVT